MKLVDQQQIKLLTKQLIVAQEVLKVVHQVQKLILQVEQVQKPLARLMQEQKIVIS